MRNLKPLSMMLTLNHGEVWLANLNPWRGTEQGKTRPVLIVQSHALLDAGHPSTLVLPLTSRLIDEAEPLRLRLPAQDQLEQDSDALVDQLRALDTGALWVTRSLPLMQRSCVGFTPRFAR